MATSLSSPGERLTSLMRRRPGKVFGVAVIEHFELAWSQVHGGPPDRLFQAGSISKPVTAVAALELVTRGDLDLDADVNERLTGWQLPGPRGVSLRQLLGHTSGLGVSFYPGYLQDGEVPTLRQSLDGAAPAATKPVRADPGPSGRFRYSGGGYAVIQQLITDATGLPFAEAARPDWHVYPEAAAAGLWTTLGDLARFAGAVAAAAAGRASPVRPETATQLLAASTPVPARGEWMILPVLGLRRPKSCGLGMFSFGDDRFGHIGGAAGFFSILVASRRDGRGAVIMTAENPSLFPFRLLRAINDEQGWTGFRSRRWPRREPECSQGHSHDEVSITAMPQRLE